jgi:hypothetical protein
MRVYLIGVNPDLSKIMYVGVNIPEEDDEVITPRERIRDSTQYASRFHTF